MSQKYTAEEVRHCARYVNPSNPVGYSGMLTQATAMLTAYADLLELIKADEVAADYPECSGDPSSCPENEGHGCCKPNPPAQAAQADEYAAGWRQAARWAKRDDLLADIGSPAYERDKAFVLQKPTAKPGAHPTTNPPETGSKSVDGMAAFGYVYQSPDDDPVFEYAADRWAERLRHSNHVETPVYAASPAGVPDATEVHAYLPPGYRMATRDGDYWPLFGDAYCTNHAFPTRELAALEAWKQAHKKLNDSMDSIRRFAAAPSAPKGESHE